MGTSYKWSSAEMSAEDYRQLFGSPEGQRRPQANDEIPSAADVPGLRDFLATTYTSPTASPTPPPSPPSPTAISGLAMSPTIVTKSGNVSFSLSGPAAVRADILDATGSVVSTLIGGLNEPAGTVSARWDRTYSDGRRARSGSYSVRVIATAAGASPTTATAPFSVR